MIKIQKEISNSGQIVLDELPYSIGEVVEIIIVTKKEITEHIKEWKKLLYDTQTYIKENNITDEIIQQEIHLYRNNQ